MLPPCAGAWTESWLHLAGGAGTSGLRAAAKQGGMVRCASCASLTFSPPCPSPPPQYRCAKAGALREEHSATFKPEFRAALDALAARPTKVG